MVKKYWRLFGIGSFIIGIFFLFNSKEDITGAIIGTSGTLYFFNLFFGPTFILIGILLFIKGNSGLENKINLDSPKEKMNNLKAILSNLFGDKLNSVRDTSLKFIYSSTTVTPQSILDSYNFLIEKGINKDYIYKQISLLGLSKGELEKRYEHLKEINLSIEKISKETELLGYPVKKLDEKYKSLIDLERSQLKETLCMLQLAD